MPQSEDVLNLEKVKTWSMSSSGVLLKKTFDIAAESLEKKTMIYGSVTVSEQINTLQKKDQEALGERFAACGLPVPAAGDNIMPAIKKVVAEFNRWAFEKEWKLLSAVDDEHAKSLAIEIRNVVKTKNMIRVGFGTGTLYQTLIGLVEDKDPDLAVTLINGMRLGKYDRHIEGGDIVQPYPKTIELTAKEMPMGWLVW